MTLPTFLVTSTLVLAVAPLLLRNRWLLLAYVVVVSVVLARFHITYLTEGPGRSLHGLFFVTLRLWDVALAFGLALRLGEYLWRRRGFSRYVRREPPALARPNV